MCKEEKRIKCMSCGEVWLHVLSLWYNCGECFVHSSDIRNTSIFRRCSKRSIFKFFLKNIIKIQRLENWPLYPVFSSIFFKTQKNVKYAYVWIELRVCHYYGFVKQIYVQIKSFKNFEHKWKKFSLIKLMIWWSYGELVGWKDLCACWD